MFYSGSVMIHSVSQFYGFGVCIVCSPGLGGETASCDRTLPVWKAFLVYKSSYMEYIAVSSCLFWFAYFSVLKALKN